MTDSEPISLDQLSSSGCGLIVDVLVEGPALSRLMAMGVCEGQTVEVIRNGDPMIVRVVGSRVGLALDLARGVRVLPIIDEGCPVLDHLEDGS